MVSQAAVIITNYNYARFVGSAIESALAQTVPCQVVVVDDGSGDDSLDVIAHYQPQVELVAKDNGGQASAFNAGFAAVDAPVVLFLDGDDRLLPTAVAEVVEAFGRDADAGRVQFRLGWIDEHDQAIPGSFPEPGRRLPAGDLTDRLISNPDDIAWQPTSGNAFRATVLKKLLPMPTEPYRISADHYLSNLSALHGPVLAIEEQLGSYRVHGANADHRPGFDVERSRDILTRTAVTNRLLIEHGRPLGFKMPESIDGFRSLSQAGLRLASYRRQPVAGHPFADDDWRGLVASGLRAARGRQDFTPLHRLAAIGWILALATVPSRAIPTVVSMALTR